MWEIKDTPNNIMEVIYGEYPEDIEESRENPYELVNDILDSHIEDMQKLYEYLEEDEKCPVDYYQLGDIINILLNIKFVKKGGK